MIARPDTHANPVSRDQVCVRGRFHYDAVKANARLGVPLIKRNGGQDNSTWPEVMGFTTARLAQIREEHGADSIGFPRFTPCIERRELPAEQDRPRDRRHQQHRLSSGPVSRARADAAKAAFGSEVLPTDVLASRLEDAARVADDIESTTTSTRSARRTLPSVTRRESLSSARLGRAHELRRRMDPAQARR